MASRLAVSMITTARRTGGPSKLTSRSYWPCYYYRGALVSALAGLAGSARPHERRVPRLGSGLGLCYGGGEGEGGGGGEGEGEGEG